MALGYDQKLYILAFDHRGSFEKMFGISGRAPTDEETAQIQDAKRLIFEGFQRAIEAGAPNAAAGVLVDGQYGPTVATDAKAAGFNLAMPVEKSGQEEFDFEYGDDFGAKILEYGPTFSKVLVRYNTEGDQGMNERQSARLKRLSDWLHENDRKFLFELLVPATDAQLAGVDGDSGRYDVEVRPGLMMAAIREILAAGIEPDIWKIEGIDSRDECREIAAARPKRRPRRGQLRGAGPRRLAREGRRMAARRLWPARLRWLRDRPLDLWRLGQSAGRWRRRPRRRRPGDRRQLPPLHRGVRSRLAGRLDGLTGLGGRDRIGAARM